MVVKEWRIDSVKLDFTSSEQGICETRALYANGVKIINALNLLDWTDAEGLNYHGWTGSLADWIPVPFDYLQVHICEECGHVNCHMGDIITIKKSGEYVLFLPAFKFMLRGDDLENELRPPEYINKEGPIVWPVKEYRELIASTGAGKLPNLDEIGDFLWWEAIRLMQWIAPGNFLGKFPTDPEPDHERIVAVSGGQPDDRKSLLKTLIGKYRDSQSAVKIRMAKESEKDLTFYHDGKGLLEWSPLVISGEDYLLQLEPGIVLEE